MKYLQAYIEGMRWMLDPANKAEAVALLVDRLKLPEDVASAGLSMRRSKGFQKDGALDMDGVRNVLKLRAQFEGGDAGRSGEVHRSELLPEGAGGDVVSRAAFTPGSSFETALLCNAPQDEVSVCGFASTRSTSATARNR